MAKVNPIVYPGRDLYCTVAKDAVRYLDCKVYGKC